MSMTATPDKNDLNHIEIPLADLRQQIIELMREGKTHIPLGDYLTLLHIIYHEHNSPEG